MKKYLFFIVVSFLSCQKKESQDKSERILEFTQIVEEKKQLEKVVENYQLEKKILLYNSKHQFLIENNLLPKDLVVKNTKGENFGIKEIVSTSTLFLRIPYGACARCIETEFQNLEEATKLKDNLVVLTSYNSLRDLVRFAERFGLQDNLFTVEDRKITTFDEEGVLFYFTTEIDLSIEYAFIPNFKIPEFTKGYFQIMEERIIDSK